MIPADELESALAGGGEAVRHSVQDGNTWINVATPQDLHPATASLVARFAAALAEKLFCAQQKYGWDTHWQSPAWMDQCREQLVEHLAKGDPRDVAAYCAFLWHHGERTTHPAGAVQVTDEAVELAAYAIAHADSNAYSFEHYETLARAGLRALNPGGSRV